MEWLGKCITGVSVISGVRGGVPWESWRCLRAEDRSHSLDAHIAGIRWVFHSQALPLPALGTELRFRPLLLISAALPMRRLPPVTHGTPRLGEAKAPRQARMAPQGRAWNQSPHPPAAKPVLLPSLHAPSPLHPLRAPVTPEKP